MSAEPPPDPGCAALVALALADDTQARLFARPRAAAALQAIAVLPAAATCFFGFEVRLDGQAGAPDILVCSRAGAEGAALAAAAARRAEGGDPAWRQVAGVLRDWTDGAAPWARSIHNVWLEFDSAAAPEPPPSCFFGVARSADGAASVPAVLQSLGLAVPAVARVLAAMPPGVLPFQFGAMLGRGPGAVRLCLRGLSRAANLPALLPALLRACGHPAADHPELPGVLDSLAPVAARLDLGFDLLKDAIGPRLHLEWPPPEGLDAIDAYLDRLAALGLCTVQERGGLRAWHGLTHEQRHRAQWPAALSGAILAPGTGASAVLVRRLHHVKLVLEPGRPTLAKAYLAAQLATVADGPLKTGLAQL
ncbi:hypothetical protein [Falsiroseomonas sp.]|uniref:hypothetical protein n=1 Tax=Falsiroseomonas sp. TaxID=2870721 RepID=UPI003F70C416